MTYPQKSTNSTNAEFSFCDFCASLWPTNELKDNLQTHPRGPTATTDKVVIQKSSGSSVRYVRTRQSGLLGMIESIERLNAIFNLQILAEPKGLEQAQVEVLHGI
jgi:hypothetical protein